MPTLAPVLQKSGLLSALDSGASRLTTPSPDTGLSSENYAPLLPLSACSNTLELNGCTWTLRAGATSIEWTSPPDVLGALISELFASTPQDVLAWVHSAAWRLREANFSERANGQSIISNGSGNAHGVSEGSDDLSQTQKASMSLVPHFEVQAQASRIHQANHISTGRSSPSPLTNGTSATSPKTGYRGSRLMPPSSTRSLRPSNSDERASPHDSTVRVSDGPIDLGINHPLSEVGKRLSAITDAALVKQEKRMSQVTSMSANRSASVHQFLSHFNVFGNWTAPSMSVKRHSVEFDGSNALCMSPTSWACFLWTGVFVTSLILELWVAPFVVFFSPDSMPEWCDEADMFFLIVFTVDVLLNLQTGYISEGALHIGRKALGQYARTWLWVDIVATVPYVAFVVSTSARESKSARCIVLVRALRLKRLEEWLCRLPIYAHRWTSSPFRFLRFFLPVVKLYLIVSFLAHMFAIIFVMLHPRQWVVEHPDGAYGCYLQTLWWSFASLTFGSTPPGPHREHQLVWDILASAGRLLLLLVVMDWSKSNSIVVFTKRIRVYEAGGGAIDLDHDLLHLYLNSRGIKPSLQVQLLQALSATEKVTRDQSSINWLSRQNIAIDLRCELSEQLWEKHIITLGIMAPLVQWHNPFVAELAAYVEEKVLPPATMLVSNGDPVLTAYLVLKGSITVLMASSSAPLVDYTQSMWIGEMALVNPELLHTETLRSRGRAELMAIHAVDFHLLLQQHNLTELYNTFLQETLWMGFCGRCGVFGDHFSRECPLLEEQSSLSIFKSTLNKLFGRRSRRKSKVDLFQLLQDNRISNMAGALRRYSITNMNDLGTSAYDEFMEDEDASISREDKEKLRKAVDKLKKKAADGTTALINTNISSHHFIFLSHYKVEAGTEATLMQKDLVGCIEKEGLSGSMASPVFVDSENLTNLTDLQDCVLRSYNLLVLLTPSVIKRPWVLMEIAIAVRHEINIVPVEIQRPDLKFTYPDESTLQRIGTGDELDSTAKDILSQEGIDLSELEAALRQLFKNIAMPYSPHKSAAIRDAELQDIIKRCNTSKKVWSPEAGGFDHRRSQPTRNMMKKQTTVKAALRNSGQGRRKTYNKVIFQEGGEAHAAHGAADPFDGRVSLAVTEAIDRVKQQRTEKTESAEKDTSPVEKKFMIGDKVKIIKNSRTKGRTAVVIDPNWHGLVKVHLDEADEKGTTKSFMTYDLDIIATADLGAGDESMDSNVIAATATKNTEDARNIQDAS